MKLNSKHINAIKEPGRYGDGAGLYLQISPGGSRSWVFRYEKFGREKMMGLGTVRDFSLAQARDRARRARVMLADGIDPIAARHAQRPVPVLTFRQAATEYYKLHEAKWHAKHLFLKSLETHAFRVLGEMDIRTIGIEDILRVLQPIWHTRTETASKVRGRLEAVLSWATVSGFRTGDNPAQWKGRLSVLLPAPSAIMKVKHLPALPFVEAPDFMAKLRACEGIAARALELTVLTAVRTSECLGALWPEVDLEAGVWTIPASRTKTDKEHRIPLSEPAIALLQALPVEDGNNHIFVGRFEGSRLGESAMAQVARQLRKGITVHGFRSTFRDWAAETTAFENDVIEMCLAHSISNQVEAAYRRGDLFDKRRIVMNSWADFCGGKVAAGNVVALRAAGG